jgi:hypothetical protein
MCQNAYSASPSIEERRAGRTSSLWESIRSVSVTSVRWRPANWATAPAQNTLPITAASATGLDSRQLQSAESRLMRRRATLAIALLLLGAGCTKTVIKTVTVTVTAPTPSPSQLPTPLPSPSPTFSDQDINDVETAVRSYFDGLANGDELAGAHTRAQWSTGDLHDWAGWIADEGPYQSSASTISFSVLHPTDLQDDIALVDLAGAFTSPDFAPRSIGGPAKVMRTDAGWKVLDYTRNERDQQAAIFTSPTGADEVSGVSARVLGVVLQADYTDVFLQITNRSGSGVDIAQDSSLVTGSGREVGGGQYYNGYHVSPGAHLTIDFTWASLALPLNTKKLRITFSASGSSSSYDFSIPIQLRG